MQFQFANTITFFILSIINHPNADTYSLLKYLYSCSIKAFGLFVHLRFQLLVWFFTITALLVSCDYLFFIF